MGPIGTYWYIITTYCKSNNSFQQYTLHVSATHVLVASMRSLSRSN